VQGLTVDETVARARENWLPLIRRNLQFWLPVQIVQFEFVPEELQVTWVAVFGLVWKIILSTLAGDAKRDIVRADADIVRTEAEELFHTVGPNGEPALPTEPAASPRTT
jgi:hypothetical protein